MLPNIALDAPRLLTIKRGKIPKIISVEKSVKKLTKPIDTTFLNPAGLCGLLLLSDPIF
jgi:hypothetical protein